MKLKLKLLLLLVIVLVIAPPLRANENVVVINPASKPVPVTGTITATTTGLATSAKQDTQITAEQAVLATAGAISGAKVITDANGTLQQYLRGLVYLWTQGPAANASTTAITPGQGVKAVASAGTPVQLVTGSTLVESVEIHARKNVTTANTGNIYVGFSATPGSNYRVLQPGESFSLSAVAGKKWQLNTIYIDAATNADAVTYTSKN